MLGKQTVRTFQCLCIPASVPVSMEHSQIYKITLKSACNQLNDLIDARHVSHYMYSPDMSLFNDMSAIQLL